MGGRDATRATLERLGYTEKQDKTMMEVESIYSEQKEKNKKEKEKGKKGKREKGERERKGTWYVGQ